MVSVIRTGPRSNRWPWRRVYAGKCEPDSAAIHHCSTIIFAVAATGTWRSVHIFKHRATVSHGEVTNGNDHIGYIWLSAEPATTRVGHIAAAARLMIERGKLIGF